jgi:hypothetical protein
MNRIEVERRAHKALGRLPQRDRIRLGDSPVTQVILDDVEPTRITVASLACQSDTRKTYPRLPETNCSFPLRPRP